tara:strand:+ start:294 stop:521 length:228 start_codon:yes stop_codon:yes gene_type:complete
MSKLAYFEKKIIELNAHRKHFMQKLADHESLDGKKIEIHSEEWEATYSALHKAIDLITDRIDEYQARWEEALPTY